MKFLLGPPPDQLSEHEVTSGAWHRLKLPPLWALHILGLPAGALVACLTLVAWVLVMPQIHVDFAPAYQIISVMAATLFSGLFVRLLSHPGWGFTSQSWVGFWPSKYTLYTAYSDEMPKRNLVLQYSIVVTVLSVLPLLVSAVFNFYSGWLIFVSCLTAFVFGIDIFIALFVAMKVPNRSMLAGKRFETYWRPRRSSEQP
jgi:hypothetical protein